LLDNWNDERKGQRMIAWMLLLAADAAQATSGMSDGLSWGAIEAIAAVAAIIVGVIATIATSAISRVASLLAKVLDKLSAIAETVATMKAEAAALNANWQECRAHDREAHGRLFKAVEEHGRKLDDHEKRITDLEE
jgi:hypothetical protein